MKAEKYQNMCNYKRGSPLHILGGESLLQVIWFAKLLNKPGYTSWGVGRTAIFVGGKGSMKFWEEHQEEEEKWGFWLLLEERARIFKYTHTSTHIFIQTHTIPLKYS